MPGAGDADAPALAAREFVREVVESPGANTGIIVCA
jgi:hypothetical protein